jgi:signal transduction histidine kinase
VRFAGDPVLVFVLGILLGAGALAPVLLRERRRGRRAAAEADAAAALAKRERAIREAAPDGLFVWFFGEGGGGHACSRRLAVLLGLPRGTDSSFADVAARFEGDARDSLDAAVAELRRAGAGFDLLLPLGPRAVQALGARALGDDGRPLADVVSMRYAGGATAGHAGIDEDAFESRLALLLDALPLPVWLRDAGLGLAFANREGRRIEGGLAEPTAGLAAKARAEAKAATERRLLVVDGQPRLADVTEAPLGPGAGTIGVAVDRSEAEAAEAELRGRVQERERVLEALATGIAVFGPDRRLAFFNSAYAATWRLEAGWLAGGPELGEILDRLREQRRLPEVADSRAFKAAQLALFQTQKGAERSLLHLPDGRALSQVVAADGLGGLVFAVDDVSQRLDLERSFKTLNAVQRATLDNLHEGVAVFGSDGRLRLFNPTFAKLWNLDAGDLAGEFHVAEFVERARALVAPAADPDAHKRRVLAKLMGRERSTGTLERTDGRIVDYADVPLPDGAMLTSYLDVTDSAKVAAALRERAQALEEASRLKSQFIANVSFEVRTPLNSIIGFAEMLAGGHFGGLSPRQQEYAQGIVDSAHALKSVIGDTLDLASVEAGAVRLERDAIELHGMLASVFKLIQERARRKELHLEFDCPPDIGWLTADERRLKQVLFHLLSNAVAFTPNRGGVRLSAAREGGEVVLAVADTGVGIPKPDLERVFRTYERGGVRPGGGNGGAGLGLSLVKSLVELHGGSVGIASQPNRGTTVTCRLPAGGGSARDAFRP